MLTAPRAHVPYARPIGRSAHGWPGRKEMIMAEPSKEEIAEEENEIMRHDNLWEDD